MIRPLSIAAALLVAQWAAAQDSRPASAPAATTFPTSRMAAWNAPPEKIGCGKFTTREPAAGETAIDKAPFKIDKAGKYILTKDITADGSAIGILADDVTIDLNGHTIKYGAGVVKPAKPIITYNSRQSGNIGHAGILLPGRPDATEDFEGFIWGKRRNITVANGRIVDGAGEGLAYCTGLNLEGAQNAEVSNVIVEVAAPDTFGLVVGPKSKVHDVTIIHNGKVVTNRHQQVADLATGDGCEVYGCLLEGGPQEGVKAGSGTSVHDNLIKLRTTVTNGYGVLGYGQKNLKVFNNWIINYNGRGIHLSEKSEGWNVWGNYVEVRETKNKEYGHMQTHGIKLETTRNSKVHDNVVLAVSSDGGEPTPFNINVLAGSNNEIWNNTFVAMTINKQGAYCVYFVEQDGNGTTIHDNTFYTNNICVYVGPDGGKDTTFERCTFRKIDPKDDVLFYADRNYKKKAEQTGGIRFIDCRFLDGIDPRGYYFPGKGSDWRSPGGYEVGWTMSARGHEGGQLGIVGVRVLDKDGKEVESHGFGSSGVRLPMFKVSYDAQSAIATLTESGSYVVEVDFGKGDVRKFTVKPHAPIELMIDKEKKGDVVITPFKPWPGQVDDDYILPLQVSGDGGEWKIAKGALPDGLTLDKDTLKGKPTKAGDFTFTVQCGQATKDITIHVAAKPDKPFWRTRAELAAKDRIAGPVGVHFDAKSDN
ncbi:MAG: hypothetical protein ACE15C_12965 [Phycisphaerae bacterium]